MAARGQVQQGASRPMLRPGLVQAWRDEDTLQIGRGGAGAVLSGLDARTRRVLPLLDGSRTHPELVATAGGLGCPPERTAELLGLLEQAGLLRDGSQLPRPMALGTTREERDRRAADHDVLTGDGGGARSAARLLVLGAGRVGAACAALLTAAGVGALDVIDSRPTRAVDTGVGAAELTDVGRSRESAARDRVATLAPSVRPGPQGLPDLVVLAPVTPEDLDGPVARAARHGPHLLLEIHGQVGIVGPLVLPGRSACLQCLDLYRTDADPQWPVLAVQLSVPSRRVQPCDGTLAVAVAAQGALQALAFVDGATPAACGGTLELRLPDWRWRRRPWARHDGCACTWTAA